MRAMEKKMAWGASVAAPKTWMHARNQCEKIMHLSQFLAKIFYLDSRTESDPKNKMFAWHFSTSAMIF
jgi:hypothetical protein